MSLKRDTSSIESVGVHLHADRGFAVILDRAKVAIATLSLKQGFDKLEDALTEVQQWVLNEGAEKVPLYFSITGKKSHFVTVKTPKLPLPVMLKAFKVQLRQVMDADPDQLFYVPLSVRQLAQAEQFEYLVANIDKEVREGFFQELRSRFKKVAGWDLDILSYARATRYLWNRVGCVESSRFLIILEWDHCHLLIGSTEGVLVTIPLSIGMSSFMEHLVAGRAQTVEVGETGIAQEDISFPSVEASEIEQRRNSAQQAIQDVYIPFAQQVKTQLYATCNEYGISLPTHFAIAGSGASLLGIREGLSQDFGISCVDVENHFPTESMVAFGAALQDKSPLRLNFCPKGGKDISKAVSEWVKQVKGRFASNPLFNVSNSEMPFLTPARLAILVGVLIGLCSIPVFQRSTVSRQLASQMEEKRQLDKISDFLSKSQIREAEFQKRVALRRLIEPKRVYLSRAMKEIIAILPASIKLESVNLKGENVLVKGSAGSHEEVQNYLKSAQTLKFLSEPIPVGVVQENTRTRFEISFRMKK